MNLEEIATDRNYPLHAFPLDSGYTLVSNPTLNWIPPSPRPIFFDTDAEAHTDWSFSGVGGETPDIVTDDLTRPTSRKNTLETEPKEQIAKARLTKMAYIVLVDALRSNAQPSVGAVIKMSAWSKSAYVSSRTPSFWMDLIDPTGLQVQFMPEIEEKRRKLHQVWQAYKVRIEYLRTEAELDGFTVNEVSEKDFWSFFRSMPFLRKAGVILMDNGNLRAVWRDEHKSRLGLQFLGDQSVEYVIFKRRQGAKDVSRAAGFDTLNGFKKQIHAFDLKTLVYT
jgi:hypothetical protein